MLWTMVFQISNLMNSHVAPSAKPREHHTLSMWNQIHPLTMVNGKSHVGVWHQKLDEWSRQDQCRGIQAVQQVRCYCDKICVNEMKFCLRLQRGPVPVLEWIVQEWIFKRKQQMCWTMHAKGMEMWWNGRLHRWEWRVTGDLWIYLWYVLGTLGGKIRGVASCRG